jgi:hypothetical protein
MGIPCFLCKNDLGRLSIKFGIKEFEMIKKQIPNGFTEDDKLCGVCYEKIKKGLTVETIEASSKQLTELKQRSPEYKKHWDKHGIIQFKNERIAILHRGRGAQVEFIVAFDDVTKEGYRLMAIDEGQEANVGGITAGVSSYYYFQKMEYVR